MRNCPKEQTYFIIGGLIVDFGEKGDIIKIEYIFLKEKGVI